VDASDIADDDVVYYLAASLDGYIADEHGGSAWLSDYFVPELGFHSFMSRVGSTIMGRRTWDRMQAMTGGKSAYGATPGTVATHRPIDPGAGPVRTAQGEAADILAVARSHGPGPFWLVGGADLATQFLLQGVLTRIDLFTMPVLLGAGIPAFRNEVPASLDLISTQTYAKGITRTSWRPRR
jgi:dihydrofolate reductase